MFGCLGQESSDHSFSGQKRKQPSIVFTATKMAAPNWIQMLQHKLPVFIIAQFDQVVVILFIYQKICPEMNGNPRNAKETLTFGCVSKDSAGVFFSRKQMKNVSQILHSQSVWSSLLSLCDAKESSKLSKLTEVTNLFRTCSTFVRARLSQL